MNNSNDKRFVYLLFAIFFVYFSFYVASSNGYYEYKSKTKTQLTQEAMLQFEEDIKNNKDVTIEEYLVSHEIDYSNNVSDMGNKFASITSKVVKGGLTKIFQVLNKLMME